jgi:hypothetical protein
MKKLKIYISISTGWAIRNYIQTGILSELSKKYLIEIICPEIYIDNIKNLINDDEIIVKKYNLNHEPLIWKIFRQTKKKIYLEARKSNTEKIWDKYGKRPAYKKIGSIIIRALIMAIGDKNLYKYTLKFEEILNITSKADSFFIEDKYNKIFLATHASTHFEETLFRAAKKKCDATILSILSWDHLSSKIEVSPGFNYIFVWNEVSKNELIETISYYDSNQVFIVGAPQFDCYCEKPTFSYDQWCKKYSLNEAYKTILFSTMPQVRHDGQHLILKNLVEAYNNNIIKERKLQFLVKIHPFDNTNIYNNLEIYDNIKFIKTSLSENKKPEEWIPYTNSMLENRDALFFSSLNINIFSTMTLEAAFLNTPIINIAFDYQGQTNPIPCARYYEFDHFKPIVNSKCSVIAYSFDELILSINNILINPDELEQNRKFISNRYLGVESGKSKESMIKNIEKICEQIISGGFKHEVQRA